MPQSLAQIYVHVVFSTKGRRPLLDDPARREETHRFLGGICNDLQCPVVRIGGVADHVHVLCRLGRMTTIADLVTDLKRRSSLWINEQPKSSPDFHWQNGYAAFSVGSEHVDELSRYIEGQEEHHRTETFQEELRRVLREYGLEFDERYVWD